MKRVTIIKRSGEVARFDPDKLHRSLRRSGAGESVIQLVIGEVEAMLYEGISTKEIYKKAFGMLRKNARTSEARYNLKKALFDLGPTGFPFEQFVAELLKCKGFETKTGQLVKGHCVQHEVDVVAEKQKKHFMVECKFHSDPSRHCDVKVPLYIQSRFKDVERQWRKKPGHDNKFHQGWVVTNTRFTSDAIDFGQCMNLYLLSWDYPLGNGLREWVDEPGAHPITCLNSITKKEKQSFLDKGMVLCRHLCDRPHELDQMGIDQKRKKKVLDEAHAVCYYSSHKIIQS